ncbi:hypothetical protein RUM44_011675 [Polyplax serrata]|uniref:Uncharacterized protein n=1 Tax=Polyplax serrata TaxID=468196 RepID=A0ABR1AQT5_POLSC
MNKGPGTGTGSYPGQAVGSIDVQRRNCEHPDRTPCPVLYLVSLLLYRRFMWQDEPGDYDLGLGLCLALGPNVGRPNEKSF